uniref:Xylanase inhibitor C-terminal domain-containing protein n=1 Tax=Cannabis sativa TaxID=3483 RepID=A0A803PXH5_CANSA
MISCQKGYVSSTYKPSRCGSATCNRAGQISTSCNDCVKGPKPGCNNNTCSVSPYNPFTLRSTGGELAQDIIAIHSTNGHNVGTRSIKINNKALKLNTTLFSISAKDGTGGTKISTSQPYTSLETSIYKVVVGEFSKALAEVPRVKAVAPFSLCFNSTSIGITRTGPAVPQIDLVLQNNNVWTIFGANSMVKVRNGVLCLGFVDGGKLYFQDFDIPYSPTAITIGGHQIEDNLLEFDLVASRLGFTSSLLFSQTSCSFKFNFTSNNAYVE